MNKCQLFMDDGSGAHKIREEVKLVAKRMHSVSPACGQTETWSSSQRSVNTPLHPGEISRHPRYAMVMVGCRLGSWAP